MRRLVIDGRTVDDSSECFVIAEVGHNHQGSVDKAKELFRRAKECGATAVKLQKRSNRRLYTRSMFDQPYLHRNSYGATYGQHREALEFGEPEYRELRDYARELGLVFFATPFDHDSVDSLARLDTPAFKIASADIRNIPLIRHVAECGKPVILSTGGAELEDVDRAFEAVAKITSQIALLQCTSSYPADFEELDLGVITTYRERYPGAVIGWSGHDNGIAMAVAAYVLGARVIEKHFTLNRALKGTDHAFSLEPSGLCKMVRDLTRVRVAMGDGRKRLHASEEPAIAKMGKKIVAARALPEGHVLVPDDLATKSPGDGLPPFEIERVLGKQLKRALAEDDAVLFEDLT